MSKDKISDYSATANSNTDIGGINIDEGCAPSGINDAIRTLMKQLKDFQQGTNSDPFNGPHNGTVGATTPASGAFTTLSATGNVTLGDSSSDTATINATATFAQAANLPNTFGFKNRIINGAMVIDQRNAGASVTPTTNGTYTLDRWGFYLSQASKFSVQQNAGSVTPPAGFTNYLGITSLSAYSVLSSDYFFARQAIEGFNFADLGWGTANARTVTLSFWVRSSLTGTFGGAMANQAENRSYPFTYTISSANTWEQKTITVAGDTTGTWIGSTNGAGLYLNFGIGVGSTLSGTAGAWAGSQFLSATGATSVVGTNGATFYITGVQLEKGSTATSFDYRPYGTELALCQRYYYQAKTGSYPGSVQAIAFSTSGLSCSASFPVTMRSTPTVVYSQGGTTNQFINVNTAGTVSQTPNQNWWSTTGISGVTGTSTVFTAGLAYGFDYTASAEL